MSDRRKDFHFVAPTILWPLKVKLLFSMESFTFIRTFFKVKFRFVLENISSHKRKIYLEFTIVEKNYFSTDRHKTKDVVT